jgi:hypothetical protein
MAISDTDEQTVVRLLLQDVQATIGIGYLPLVQESAAHVREYASPDQLDWYVGEVVDEVQQVIHDCFIDTTWPACPRHPNHPLWFDGSHWRCEKDAVQIAKLGELANVFVENTACRQDRRTNRAVALAGVSSGVAGRAVVSLPEGARHAARTVAQGSRLHEHRAATRAVGAGD